MRLAGTHFMPNTCPYKRGQYYPYWFNQEAVIIDISPYRGCYPQWFRYVLKITNPNNWKGWSEIVVPAQDDRQVVRRAKAVPVVGGGQQVTCPGCKSVFQIS